MNAQVYNLALSLALAGLTTAQPAPAPEPAAPLIPYSAITAELVHQPTIDTRFWERLTERMIGDIDEVRTGMGLSTLHDAAMRRLYNTEIKPVEFVSGEEMAAATRRLCRG